MIGFSGSAASAGIQLSGHNLLFGMSGRLGSSLHSAVGDTILSRGRVPNHFGATLAYMGVANSTIAIRTAKDTWSQLNGLSPDSASGVDGWDSSIGADIAGPRLGNRILFLRGGLRTRTLPFRANGNTVTENSAAGGLGTTFANGRVLTDFAAIYAKRDANIPASEHSWTLSIGLSIRP
jgi:hypothetical protein